jgi:formylglycine-generating enzyme required for sulfatase activity
MVTKSLGVLCAMVAILGHFVGASAEGPAGRGAAAGKSHEVRDLKMTLVRIERGEFLMGSPEDEASRGADETQHKVKLTKPFYLQTTEVSQRQYQAVMGENPSSFKGDDLPVENVSWAEAAAFCLELGRREGRRFRLPTEAEWEYAARAGKAGPVAGTGKLQDMAWHADNSGKAKVDSARLWDTDPDNYFARLHDNGCQPRAVGTGTANDWGVHDMQGNVTEWVADWYSQEYFREDAAKVDPWGPKQSELGSRVMRGGSWGSDPRNCRVANRDYNIPGTQSASCGFRIAMDSD